MHLYRHTSAVGRQLHGHLWKTFVLRVMNFILTFTKLSASVKDPEWVHYNHRFSTVVGLVTAHVSKSL